MRQRGRQGRRGTAPGSTPWNPARVNHAGRPHTAMKRVYRTPALSERSDTLRSDTSGSAAVSPSRPHPAMNATAARRPIRGLGGLGPVAVFTGDANGRQRDRCRPCHVVRIQHAEVAPAICRWTTKRNSSCCFRENTGPYSRVSAHKERADSTLAVGPSLAREAATSPRPACLRWPTWWCPRGPATC